MSEPKAEAAPGSDGALVDAARKVERGLGKAKNIVHDKMEHAKDGVASLRAKSFDDLADSAKDYVKENPGKTVMISLGVGALLGALIARRR